MPFVVEYVSNHLTAAKQSAAKETITLADVLDLFGGAAGLHKSGSTLRINEIALR